MKKYVIDTSAVIEKAVTQFYKEKKIDGTILIPNAVVGELENQANKGQEIGFIGLEEIQQIRKLNLKIEFVGERANETQIKFAKSGEIDALIRDIANKEKAILITADKVQAESGKAFGLEVIYLAPKELTEKIEIESFFDDTTMSIHLKEKCFPFGKKGFPGQWKLEKISDEILTSEKIQELVKEIIERSRIDEESFIEISRRGSTIVQYKNYRIVIVKPPVSDGWEITVVRPIKKLDLEEYKINEELLKKLKQARGVIIAGETGSGKCLPKGTKIYLKNNIIKNIENVNINDVVLTYNKNCQITHEKVINKFTRKSKTIKIKTNFGKEIELTPEHPVLSFKDGIPKWVNAKELILGNRIATVRKLNNEGSLQVIDWVDLLPEEKFLVKLKEDLNIEIPIEEVLLGLKSKIITIIKNTKNCKQIDINNELNSTSGWIRVLLLQLNKEGIILRKKQDKFIYNLAKDKIKLKKEELIPLKTLKKYLTKEEIYEITDKILHFGTWHKSEPIKPPRFLTQEICELLGYYIGECLTKYGISTDSKFCQKRFVDLSKNIFDIDVNKQRKGTDVYTDKGKTIEIFLNRCLDISLLNSKKRATYHRIPKLILNSTKLEMASFLRAYFDTESYVHEEKGIEISSASIGLIKDTQLVLLNFNIQSSIRKKIINNKPYYILYIYRYNNVKKFQEEISLIEKEWQARRYLENNKAGSPNKDTIPIGYLLNKINLREELHIKYPFLKRDFSHEQTRKMISLIIPQITNEISINDLAMIQLASSEYIQWDKVIGREEIKEEKEVFDIEVENTHNFLAGDVPFIVHNSTIAQALAEDYSKSGKITKTVESPRDLQLNENITQYSKNFTNSEEIHDILFLSRPDYIIFDEMRDTPDFQLYIDIRLAGSNVIGVLHSATPIDAVQRFIRRLDTGMIPSVVDTILYIDKGKISKVYTLKMLVKVPTGMTESDLARPIVEVRDFEIDKLEYEIYSYGEETVVIPISKEKKRGAKDKLAEKSIKEELLNYVSEVEVEMLNDNRAVIYIPAENISRVIGAQGKTIEKIENKLGIGIEVREIKKDRKTIPFKIQEENKLIRIFTEENKDVEIFIENEFLLTAISSKKGEIKIHKKSNFGRDILKAVDKGKKIELRA